MGRQRKPSHVETATVRRRSEPVPAPPPMEDAEVEIDSEEILSVVITPTEAGLSVTCRTASGYMDNGVFRPHQRKRHVFVGEGALLPKWAELETELWKLIDRGE